MIARLLLLFFFSNCRIRLFLLQSWTLFMCPQLMLGDCQLAEGLAVLWHLFYFSLPLVKYVVVPFSKCLYGELLAECLWLASSQAGLMV